MLGRIIEWSVRNKFLVILATLLAIGWGLYSLLRTPVDAIPDLSDVQVIIYTPFPGQSPRIIEDQVTYPLTTAMVSVPRSRVVRGYSFFGYSLVYVIFEDGTDLYWARSRVLEYLNYAADRLPRDVQPALGPDAKATGGGSTAVGSQSSASGLYSSASGESSTASGGVSTASGSWSTASGAAIVDADQLARQVEVVAIAERLDRFAVGVADDGHLARYAIERRRQRLGEADKRAFRRRIDNAAGPVGLSFGGGSINNSSLYIVVNHHFCNALGDEERRFC